MIRPQPVSIVPAILFLAATSLVYTVGLVGSRAKTYSPTYLGAQANGGKQVLLNVIVTDRQGHYVTGLGKSNFKVFDDNVPREIVSFSKQAQPASIGILLDTSGSLARWAKRGNAWNLLTQTLSRFIDLGDNLNEYFVVVFGEQPKLVLDWTDNAKHVKDALGELDDAIPKGNTALYDSCYLGIEQLSKAKNAKRILIIISDGQDNNSKHRFSQVREALRESGDLVYAVFVVSPDPLSTSLGDNLETEEGKGVLTELAKTSGGLVFQAEEVTKIPAVFESIANELSHQYFIGFKPADPSGNGKWHRIKVSITMPPNASPEMQHVSVNTRQGYYSKLSQP